MMTKERRKISIKRPQINDGANPEVSDKVSNLQDHVTGAINLAGAPKESDFLQSLKDLGYTVLDKNRYGVTARPAKGKPAFIPFLDEAYNPSDNTRITLNLPASIYKKVKVKSAMLGITINQLLIQLLLDDLEK